MSDIKPELVEKACAAYRRPGRMLTNDSATRHHDCMAAALEAVVDDLVRQAKAEAWEEGYDMSELGWNHVYDGHDCAEGEMCPTCCQPNPYGEREGAEQPSSRLSCDTCGNLKDTPLHELGCSVGRKEYGHE